MKEKLLKKIIDKTAVMGVIGLGYVGLPLAVEAARAGYRTFGFELDNEKVNMVNKGISYIGDVLPSNLRTVVNSGELQATEELGLIQEVDCLAICVPTPLDKHNQPDISCIIKATEDIGKYWHKGMLIVLESTTYPGTTEEAVKPILEKNGFEVGNEFFLAFSPERVDPGNKKYNTRNTPKVVGGVTQACTEIAAQLYQNILESNIHKVSSPAVAEMEKILENTFRNVNIALVNEMAILCYKMGIDVWEVIEAAKTKPYGFYPFYPGPGVGGHCIAIDPFYLTWKAKEYKYPTRLIETAGAINNFMPEFVVERSMRILNSFGTALSKSRILLLGIAYKEDIDDIRESPALEILKYLEVNGAEVVYNDPFVPSVEYLGKKYYSRELNQGLLEQVDLVIITTAHKCYDYIFIQNHAKFIFDTRNAMVNNKGLNFEKL